jgi:hypothetical protein
MAVSVPDDDDDDDDEYGAFYGAKNTVFWDVTS